MDTEQKLEMLTDVVETMSRQLNEFVEVMRNYYTTYPELYRLVNFLVYFGHPSALTLNKVIVGDKETCKMIAKELLNEN